MKRIIVSLVVLCLLVSGVTTVSLANEIQTLAAECSAIAVLSFSNGRAQAVGSTASVPKGYTVDVAVTLQKKSGDTWLNVATGSGKTEASVSANAIRGVTYRAYVTCSVYDSEGKYVDRISATSAAKEYK